MAVNRTTVWACLVANMTPGAVYTLDDFYNFVWADCTFGHDDWKLVPPDRRECRWSLVTRSTVHYRASTGDLKTIPRGARRAYFI